MGGFLPPPASAGGITFPGQTLFFSVNNGLGLFFAGDYYVGAGNPLNPAIARLGVGSYQITWGTGDSFAQLGLAITGQGVVAGPAGTPLAAVFNPNNGVGTGSIGIDIYSLAGALADLAFRGFVWMT